MNLSALTTARWHLLNTDMPWAKETSAAVIELLNDKLGYAPPSAQLSPIAPPPPVDSKQVIALCLGHGRAIDEGNVGFGGISEEDYNLPRIDAVAGLLRKAGYEVITITFYQGNGYEAAMNWLAKELLNQKATVAIEFHFNASEKGTARGHEVLHWEGSVRGLTLADSILQSLTDSFPTHPSRGLKPKNAKDRGAMFLSRPHCPCALIEPFFGDNSDEWAQFSNPHNMERLDRAIAWGIIEWAEKQEGKA